MNIQSNNLKTRNRGGFIERAHCGLPDWFLPNAIGAAVPSDRDLTAAGFRYGALRPQGWMRKDVGVFRKPLGGHVLWVRSTIGKPLWTAERVGVNNDDDHILFNAMC